jgi:hypothetical protein
MLYEKQHFLRPKPFNLAYNSGIPKMAGIEGTGKTQQNRI